MEIGHPDDPYETKEDVAAKTCQQRILRGVFHLVIPSKSRDCVLGEILPNGMLRLPRTEPPVDLDDSLPNKEDEVERWIEGLLGISGYIARNMWNGFNTRMNTGDGIKENEILLVDTLEDDSPVQTPFEWIRRDIACKSKWVPTNEDGKDDHVKLQLQMLFRDINRETRIGRFEAWKRIGWFERLTSWTRGVLEARNMAMEGRVRKWRRTDISLVMSCAVKIRSLEEGRWEESIEVIFIKTGVPTVREAQRTATIGAVVGRIVPEVIGVHESEGIMIQRNGGEVTDEPFDQEALMDTIVKMQMLSIDHIGELERCGLKVLNSEWLESNIEWILNHELFDDYYRSGPSGEVNETEKRFVDDLRSKVGEIQKGCRMITRLSLPRTLVHGDLQLHNVGSPLKEEGKVYQMFDWAGSFIGSPLHDFESLLSNAIDEFPGYSIDNEACLKRACKQWMPTGTSEETDLAFDVTCMMTNIIWIYNLIQEHDGCGGHPTERQDRIRRQARSLIGDVRVSEPLN